MIVFIGITTEEDVSFFLTFYNLFCYIVTGDDGVFQSYCVVYLSTLYVQVYMLYSFWCPT